MAIATLLISSAILKATGAVVVIVVAFVVLLYYRYMAYKQFGGVTGDLAGYLLCVSELCSDGTRNLQTGCAVPADLYRPGNAVWGRWDLPDRI